MDEQQIRGRARAEREKLEGQDGDETTESLLKRAFDKRGMKLLTRPPGDSLLAGAFAVIVPEQDYVAIDDTLPLSRRNFILAHEFAHLILHGDNTGEAYREDETQEAQLAFSMLPQTEQIAEGYSPAERRERQANLFAAEFLLPSPYLRSLLRNSKLSASEIAARWSVSLTLTYSQLAQALLLPEEMAEEIDKESNSDSSLESFPVRLSLSPSQREAATATEPITLVDAGPGTGKTRTLIARIVWLIETEKVSPDKILALTYTNRAAEEMRTRLFKALGEAANRVWVGTYHAFGFEILKKEAEKLGLPPRPTLLDAADATLLLEQIHYTLGLKRLHYSHDPTTPYSEILECISRAKDDLLSPERFREIAAEQLFLAENKDENEKAIERARKWKEVGGVYDKYQIRLQETGSLDFGDLLMRPLELFTQLPERAKHWSDAYPHVLADEYQDVNLASVRLLQTFVKNGSHLWTVGDARQAIFLFRGASPRNLTGFTEDFPDGTLRRLTGNYRSTPPVLELVNLAASEIASPSPESGKWNSERKTESLSDRRVFWHEAQNETAQLDYLVSQIRELERQGVSLEDQTILVYKNKTRHALAQQLEEKGVAVQHVGSLFDRPEVKDLLALMEFVTGVNEASFRRVATLSRYAMPEKDIKQIFDYAANSGNPRPTASFLMDAESLLIVSTESVPACLRLSQDLADWGNVRSAWRLLSDFLFQKSNFLAQFETGSQERIAIYHLLAFAQGAESAPFVRESEKPLSAFVVYLRRLLGLGESRSKRFSLLEGKAKGVQILTMHSAKGLEFPAVHLPDLDDALFSSQDTHRFVEPLSLSPKSELNPDNRLLFVALSRAQDYLSLSRCLMRKGKPKETLEFLAPLKAALEASRVLFSGEESAILNPTLLHRVEPQSETMAKPEVNVFALKKYEECPRLYSYLYRENLPDSSSVSPYRKALRVMRNLLSKVGNPQANDAPKIIESLEMHFLQLWKEAFPYSTDETEALKLEKQALLPALDRLLREHPQLSVSRWFRVQLEAGILSVPADFTETTKGGKQKFSLNFYRPRKTDDHLSWQITGLRLAAEAEGKEPEITLRYLGQGQDFVVPSPQGNAASRRSEQKRRDEIAEALQGIAQGHFPPEPKDSTICVTCPFYFLCPT